MILVLNVVSWLIHKTALIKQNGGVYRARVQDRCGGLERTMVSNIRWEREGDNGVHVVSKVVVVLLMLLLLFCWLSN